MAQHMRVRTNQRPRRHRGGRLAVAVALVLVAALGFGTWWYMSRGGVFGGNSWTESQGTNAGSSGGDGSGGTADDKGSADGKSAEVDDTDAGDDAEVGGADEDGAASQLEQMLDADEVQSVRLIGDSITAGYLCDGYDAAATSDVVVYSGPEGTYTETPSSVQCWANDFRSYAESRGVGSFVNAGVSGFRMSYLAESPDSWLGDGADVIVVMLGTNDACKESVANFEQYATTALAAAAQKCRLLVVVSPPNNERTDAVNLYGMNQIDAALTEVCESQSYVHVSLYDVLELGTDDFNSDQVHPTSAGSHKLWLALKDRLDLS